MAVFGTQRFGLLGARTPTSTPHPLKENSAGPSWQGGFPPGQQCVSRVATIHPHTNGALGAAFCGIGGLVRNIRRGSPDEQRQSVRILPGKYPLPVLLSHPPRRVSARMTHEGHPKGPLGMCAPPPVSSDDDVIAGWDAAVTTMSLGELATFHIPAHMAYGTKGGVCPWDGTAFPPNADLELDLELVTVGTRRVKASDWDPVPLEKLGKWGERLREQG